MRPFLFAATALLLVPLVASAPTGPATLVRAVAVAQTASGLVGSVANVSISQEGGTGLLFLDTQPFSQVDLQGSARLAVRVAGAVTGLDVSLRDFFIVVRSDSRVIGGPSAGGVLTVGAIAALKGWSIDPRVFMTGTINPDGSIGPVGGIPEKAQAAAEEGAAYFLFPVGEETATAVGAQGRYTVNLVDYCARQLQITCKSVGTVEDAVAAFTGHSFERPALPTAGTDARYQAVMRGLADREINRSSHGVDAVAARFASASNVPAAAAADVEAKLREGRAALEEGRAAYNQSHYYTAASRSFVAAIRATYVGHLLDFFDASDRSAFVQARLSDSQAQINATFVQARNEPVRGLSQLEAVGAAQARVTDAEKNLAGARAALRTNDALQVLFPIAVSQERAQTAVWWLEIGRAFADGDVIPPSTQIRQAKEAIDESGEVVTYAASVLSNGGADASVLAPEEARLNQARDDADRGFPAAALYQALEAQVRAGIALETAAFGNNLPPQRLAQAQAAAVQAIAQARARGVEPVLAASDAEFAGDQADPAEQLKYYDLARIIARSQDLYSGARGDHPVPSAYIGTLPETKPAGHGAAWALGILIGVAVAAAMVALVAAFGPRRRAPLPPTSHAWEGPPAPPASSVQWIVEPTLAPPAAKPKRRTVRRPAKKPRSVPRRRSAGKRSV